MNHRLRLKWLVFLLIALHLLSLTKFPVFADEAIYLRWSQSAIRDAQYLFLPMLDGKPPLHSWLLAPFQVFFSAVFGGRLLSVILAVLGLFGLVRLVREMGGKKMSQLFGAVSFIVLPYWFFHAHLALAEMLLAVAWIWMLIFGIRVVREKTWIPLVGLGLCFGIALWTKTTALFFIPVLAILPWVLQKGKDVSGYVRLGLAGLLGIGLFATLAVSPLFPALFSRSEDYTFSLTEVFKGEWRYVLFSSIPKVTGWLIWYLTPFVIVLSLFAPASSRRWWLSVLLFSAPLLLVGKVLSPRYFLPVAVPLTLLASLGLERVLQRKHRKLAVALSMGMMLLSTNFLVRVLFFPDSTPFVATDRKQYLEDWSSGHGIAETAAFLQERARQSQASIVVGTEGNFGSLPDGLTIEFFQKPEFGRVRIEGIGQPVREIPEWMREAVLAGAEGYLVVNSNRLAIADESLYEVVQSFPRPGEGPKLMVLKIRGN